jgi:hypothetical protein
MADNMKRYQVRADKRAGAREDLSNSIWFIVEKPQYKDAWDSARKMCSQGVGIMDNDTVSYVTHDGTETYEDVLLPGQFTVKQVLTLDKPQGAASKAKEPTAVQLVERAEAQGINVAKKLKHLIDVMREEQGLNTGNPDAKQEAERNAEQEAAAGSNGDLDATDEAAADEQRNQERQEVSF